MPHILRPAALLLLALGGCHSASHDVPGDRNDHKPWHGIAASETVFLTGTEPFWGGKVEGNMLTYTTPEKPDGVHIPIERFAGRGGVSFGGELDGKRLTIALGPDDCSDGMSDRHYPFAATLQLGDETRMGCGWTTAHPATGPKTP